jgi:hypothetical protein
VPVDGAVALASVGISTTVAIVGVCVAAAGYLVTFFANLLVAQHTAKVERLRTELREFYGPLYIASLAGRAAYLEYLARIGMKVDPEDVTGREIVEKLVRDPHLTGETRAEWWLWFTQVFGPLDDLRGNLVLNKGHLTRVGVGDLSGLSRTDIDTRVIANELIEMVVYAHEGRVLRARGTDSGFPAAAQAAGPIRDPAKEKIVPEMAFPAKLLETARDGYMNRLDMLEELERPLHVRLVAQLRSRFRDAW